MSFWKFLDKIYENDQGLWEIYKEWLWTKEWIAWKFYFENEYIDVHEIQIIELFFNEFLNHKWIRKTSEHQKAEQNHLLYNDFITYIEDLIWTAVYIKTSKQNIEWTDDLIQLLLLIISKTKELPTENIENFIDTSIKALEILNKQNFNNHIVWYLLDQIKISFPEIYTRELTLFKIEAVLLWKGDSKTTYLLDKWNFYFSNRKKEKENKSDVFPKNNMNIIWIEEDIDWLKDIHVFDIYWKKVYNWDLVEKNISKLRWTYYILSEEDAITNIPESAKANNIALIGNIVAKHWSEPLDLAFLDKDYIIINALWKIQDWKYIENVREITY
jgi:hypothetical protein